MNLSLSVSGNTGVRSLAGKHITHSWLIFNQVHDIFLPKPLPLIESSSIIFNSCDKNFVYYALHPEFFPKLQKVYLASHPCESDVFRRFRNLDIEINLIDNLRGYKSRWANDMKNVKLISNEELKHIMKNLE